jgi:3-oxosteroid 1-dehydrogenase
MAEELTVDLLIVGSGAAAMAAAIRAHDLGLHVLVVEKSTEYGGSTAMSGGVCWVPCNPHMATTGIADSREDALTYLKHITGGEIEEARLATYVDESVRMVRWFEAHSHLRFDPIATYTDYYPEAPGGRPGGRSMESRPWDATALGRRTFGELRLPHPQSQIMGMFGIRAAMAPKLLVMDWRAKLSLLGCFLGFLWRKMIHHGYGRDTKIFAGNAMIGRLRRSMADREIEIWLDSPATALHQEGGRVTGAAIRHEGEDLQVRARAGVLLATGGFAHSAELRAAHQRAPTSTQWTAASPANTGDGHRLGQDAGGVFSLMKEAWWTPTTRIPRSDLGWVLVVEKSLPGSIFINGDAQRFTNEAAPYVDVVLAIYGEGETPGTHLPCWMVFDARFRENYPCGSVAPAFAMPDKRLPRRLREDFLHRSETLDELAEKIGVDGSALHATVARFNEMAKKGVDTDFGRGESGSDRYYGDRRVQPNPCLAPLERGPFYAIEVHAGDLGTKGGLVTDNGARVTRTDGSPIPGLYAAGNVSASIMGRSYPGAGGTIGPALTFGMIAAESAAQSLMEDDGITPRP